MRFFFHPSSMNKLQENGIDVLWGYLENEGNVDTVEVGTL